MNTSFISSTSSSYASPASASYTSSAKTKEAQGTEKADDKDVAAVYEKSSEKAVTGSTKNTENLEKNRALVEQMKQDLATRQQQLTDIVSKMMEKQGKAIGLSDDMWKFLASGDYEVDPATKKQAEEDISEDGYWGVEKTSDRIVDFAKVLAGDDPDKADKMIEAFKKGYEQATGAWGKDLPDISQKTYDAVIQKMEDWKKTSAAQETGAQ